MTQEKDALMKGSFTDTRAELILSLSEGRRLTSGRETVLPPPRLGPFPTFIVVVKTTVKTRSGLHSAPLLGLDGTIIQQSIVITWASPMRSGAAAQLVGLLANGLPVQALFEACTGAIRSLYRRSCGTKLGPHLTDCFMCPYSCSCHLR
jgi:hypothetical protein